MKYKEIIRKVIVSIFILTILSQFYACKKWLNVLPENETEATSLFSTERGFQEALSGVYTLMSEGELYGRELTYGFADVIAQQYGFRHEVSPYFYTQFFEFKKESSLQLSNTIWKKQFNAIANVNNILAFIDKNEPVFTSATTHSIIKGEALAIRAFLHFDLLRLYAPHKIANNEIDKWLPYVDEFTKNTSQSISFDAYLDKVLADLTAAEQLLKVDPILTGKTLSDLYFKNRQYHLNYYAVKGLMARLYLYRGNSNTEAFNAAKEVIDAQQKKGLFPFVTALDATNVERNKRDRTFSTEHVFTLNVRSLQTFITGYVSQVQGGLALVPRESLDDLFENYPDYRKEFFETDGTVQNVPSKFWQVDPLKKFTYKMPMIRITEMYYIAAETTTSPAQTLTYLNKVRQARNISVPLVDQNAEVLKEQILKEYKKEFFGEGQLFYYFKRHNALDAGGWTQQFKYVLPMPEEEINFGDRPRPI